ncbi:DUF488 family protein [Dactylosporangium sucinum]|uniref:DUF488 domain-containing protein n=1 Tax=Dactylosporangium sucinum TaxID=1424081 RepID=A0A917WR07_9ACTN|nr:DUF488 domain-containing protein [Dactylosporangium sucinum]GGM22433.1 hypothetical protein GCM10007977_024490 [Dactylosporangium sucinum]
MAEPAGDTGRDALRLLGVGYEGHTLASLIAQLRAAGMTRLVDVRQQAASRRPGFAKSALRQALAAAGIAYEHQPELGNPRDNRPGFGSGPAELDAARATYAAWLTRPAALAALDALVDAARREPVAVLCLEADPQRCHRWVLLRTAWMRASSGPAAGPER